MLLLPSHGRSLSLLLPAHVLPLPAERQAVVLRLPAKVHGNVALRVGVVEGWFLDKSTATVQGNIVQEGVKC